MRYFGVITAFFTVIFLAAGSVTVSAMRCGNRIVGEGDTKAEVLVKCGQPLLREYIGEDVEIEYGYGTYSKRIVEEWTYNFGPSKFMQILHFRGNKLIEIRNGDKGF